MGKLVLSVLFVLLSQFCQSLHKLCPSEALPIGMKTFAELVNHLRLYGYRALVKTDLILSEMLKINEHTESKNYYE